MKQINASLKKKKILQLRISPISVIARALERILLISAATSPYAARQNEAFSSLGADFALHH